MLGKLFVVSVSFFIIGIIVASQTVAAQEGGELEIYAMCGAYMAEPGELTWCDGGGCSGNVVWWGNGTCADITCRTYLIVAYKLDGSPVIQGFNEYVNCRFRSSGVV